MNIRFKMLFGALLFFGMGGFLTLNAQSTELKVMAFNVRSFEPDFDVKPYAEALQAEDLDIICLNEVENRSSRQKVNGKYRDVVYDLAQNLNMFSIFGYSYSLPNKAGDYPIEHYKYDKNELYGNAILSKYPILNSQSVLLPRPAGSSDQRSALYVDLLLPSQKVIRVVVTHLDHTGGRLAQAKALMEQDFMTQDMPTLLVGDLNEWQGGNAVSVIKKKLDILFVGGEMGIDYVLGSKKDWKFLRSKVLGRYHKGRELSDHNPIIAVVKPL